MRTLTSLSFNRYALLIGVVLHLVACGNENGGGKRDGGSGSSAAAPAQNLSYPQNLQFTGVDSNGASCNTPLRVANSAIEYCQLLKDPAFGNCAQDQSDRLFNERACATTVGETLNSKVIWCEAKEESEFEPYSVSRRFNDGNRSKVNGAQIRVGGSSSHSFKVGQNTVFIDQVKETDGDIRLRMTMARRGEKGFKTSMLTTLMPKSVYGFKDLENGKSVYVACMKGRSVTDSNVGGQPGTGVTHANYRIRCEGTIKRGSNAHEERFEKTIEDVSASETGDDESIYSIEDTQITLRYERAGLTSVVPYFQIRAEGIGSDLKEMETAGQIGKPQVMEYHERNTGYELRVTCTPRLDSNRP